MQCMCGYEQKGGKKEEESQTYVPQGFSKQQPQLEDGWMDGKSLILTKSQSALIRGEATPQPFSYFESTDILKRGNEMPV